MPDAILGTGMAGSTHWSLALEQTSTDSAAAELVWDVAARLRKGPPTHPDHLGSEYELGSSVTAQIDDQDCLSLCCKVAEDEHCCSLFVMDAGDQLPRIELLSKEGESPQRIRVTVATDSAQSAQTVRWKYGLRGEASDKADT